MPFYPELPVEIKDEEQTWGGEESYCNQDTDEKNPLFQTQKIQHFAPIDKMPI
jgi:hypothetical protein